MEWKDEIVDETTEWESGKNEKMSDVDRSTDRGRGEDPIWAKCHPNLWETG